MHAYRINPYKAQSSGPIWVLCCVKDKHTHLGRKDDQEQKRFSQHFEQIYWHNRINEQHLAVATKHFRHGEKGIETKTADVVGVKKQ